MYSKKETFHEFPIQKTSEWICYAHTRSCRPIVGGMEAQVAYLKDQHPESAALLTRKEKKADEYLRILIYALNKTFVTPFDRVACRHLSKAADRGDEAINAITSLVMKKE